MSEQLSPNTPTPAASRPSFERPFDILGTAPAQTAGAVSLIDTYRTKPTQSNLRAVVGDLGQTIDRALKTYAPGGNPIVQQRARLLAAKAVKSYDPTAGANLQTHVYRQLQELQRTAPQIQEPMVMPERLRRDRGAVLRAIDETQNDLGREASDEEISEATGLPVKRIVKVRSQMRAGMPTSVIENQDDEDDDDSSYDHVQHASSPEEDWLDAVYHDLGDIDRLILQYRSGYRGVPQLSNQEIAKQLKLSPSAVTQRANRIQARLDQFHE
mgnify:CR=1 FL=1